MHQTYHCLVYVTANSCLRLLTYYLFFVISILFSYLISLHLNCNHPIVISSLLDESSPLALQEINVGVSAKTQDIASMYCDVAARPMFGNAREWSLSSVFCPRNRTVSDLKENRI